MAGYMTTRTAQYGIAKYRFPFSRPPRPPRHLDSLPACSDSPSRFGYPFRRATSKWVLVLAAVQALWRCGGTKILATVGEGASKMFPSRGARISAPSAPHPPPSKGKSNPLKSLGDHFLLVLPSEYSHYSHYSYHIHALYLFRPLKKATPKRKETLPHHAHHAHYAHYVHYATNPLLFSPLRHSHCESVSRAPHLLPPPAPRVHPNPSRLLHSS